MLAAVAEACEFAMYWQEPWPEELDLARDPEQVRAAAEELAGRQETSWWHAPVDLADQHFCISWTPGEDVPAPPQLRGLLAAVTADLDELAARIARSPAPAPWRDVSGAWWSFPWALDAPRTDTARMVGEPPAPAALVWIEDSFGPEAGMSWRVGPPPDARVYEVDGPAAWAALVRAHPFEVTATTKSHDWRRATGRNGRWAMPDWRSVAEQWDGVHVTVAGYLTTAGRALDIDDQLATVLAGWEPDRTFWLTDDLRLLDDGTRWTRDEDDWVWRRA